MLVHEASQPSINVNETLERRDYEAAMTKPSRMLIALFLQLTIAVLTITFYAPAGAAEVQTWHTEWPATDFSKHTVEFSEIRSGGPPKDGIPAIDAPRFEQLDAGRAGGWAKTIGDNEPVISLVIAGDARAYPVRILIWHEIVNDTVGGIPVVITYCPLCNSGLVFERALADRVLDFGTTGKLRNSDLVMYDRQTESWWQQFTGEAIVGTLSGRGLRLVPSRMESLLRFRQRFPGGKVLVRPTRMRAIMGQILTSDTTRKGSGRSSMMDRCPRESIPWSAWSPSNPRPGAMKPGRSHPCGARAESRSVICCSPGNPDRPLRSMRAGLQRAGTWEPSWCKGSAMARTSISLTM